MPKQPVTGDELRAIKRFLATRQDSLPWLFVSERQCQLTRQAINYIVRVAGERAKLAAFGHTCSGTVVATISPIRAPICAPCRMT